MIRRSIRLVWSGAVLAFVAYLLFFVQLGERSAFGHLMRVINTDEAQELGREVSAATERMAKRIGDGGTFRLVIGGRPGAMGVDIINARWFKVCCCCFISWLR